MRSQKKQTLACVFALFALAMLSQCPAGCLFGRAAVRRHQRQAACRAPAQCRTPQTYGAYQYQETRQSVTTYTQAQATYSSADSHGFLAWINEFRASLGLGAVRWDQEMANEAAINSQMQASRGPGHHYRAAGRVQNSGWGASGPALYEMWKSSPEHCRALMDPNITSVGLAHSGPYSTFSGR